MGGEVLIDPESGLAHELDPGAAQHALQQGWHVPLYSPEGEAISAPLHEARTLLAQGHTQPTQPELVELLKQAKASTPGQQALAFAEGMAEPLTAGTYGYLAGKTGLTTPENVAARARYNPGTHALGETTGLVGGLVGAPEASIPGIIAKAGGAAAEAAAIRGGTGLLSKAAQMAAQGAVEGGLFAATHEASEALLGDPNATAENMVSQIGLNAALGGGLSLALSPAFTAMEHAVSKGAGFLGRQTGKEAVQGATLPELMPHMGMPESEVSKVMKGLSELKENAPEIIQDAAVIDAPVLESQISNSKFVHNLDSNLMKEKSWTGIQRQQLAHEGYKAATRAVDEALGNDLGMTKAQVGNELKRGLIENIEAEHKPISDLYEAVQSLGQGVPLEQGSLESAAKGMTDIEGLMSSKGAPISERSPGYQLAKRAEEELPKLGTIEDLRLYSQRLKQDTLGKPELSFVAGQIQKKISELEEKAVLNTAKSLNDPSLTALLDAHAEAKTKYGALRDKIEGLGDVIGKKLRKGEGPQAFMNWLQETAPEQVADRLFTKKNSEFLKSLGENFPKEADLLKNLKKSQLRDAAIKDGKIQPNTVLREVGKLEPEIKDFLFSAEDLKKIKASQTYLEAFPKDVNPSGTAEALHLHNLFNPTKFFELAAAQTSSYLKKKVIEQLVRSSPGDAPLMTALLHINDFRIKAARDMERHAAAVFGRGVGSLMEPERPKEQRRGNEPVKMNKLGNVIMAKSNPETLVDHLSEATMPLQEHTPAVMASFSGSVGTAVSFLKSKLPGEMKQAPLDTTPVPSNTEMSKFNRYAQIVEDPMLALSHVKNGTLLGQDLETLTTVYPAMYNKMKETLTEKMVDHLSKRNAAIIPYKTRLGLSMFLGTNLDSTISPQSIQSNQASLAVGRAQQQMQTAQQTNPSKVGMRQMKSFTNEQTTAQSALNRHGRTA